VRPKGPMKVLLVYSTSHALRIEKLLKKRELTCKLVPVPRHLSSDCGICVRFRESDEAEVAQVVEEAYIETRGIYPVG